MSESAVVIAPESHSNGNGTEPNDQNYGLGAQKRIKQLLLRAKQAEARAERAEAALEDPAYVQSLLADEYQRGWDECESWKLFQARLAEARQKYGVAEFDQAMARVPRSVIEAVENCDDGLDLAWLLSQNSALCQEIARMEPRQAAERFQHFAKDVQFLIETKGATNG